MTKDERQREIKSLKKLGLTEEEIEGYFEFFPENNIPIRRKNKRIIILNSRSLRRENTQ